MAEYVPDITITSEEYVSLNTASGISVGVELNIMLKSSTWVRLVESATKPASTVEDGLLLTDLTRNYAVAHILPDSLEIWAISGIKSRTATISVQEL